ncbi:purine operon repressor [Cerasibacillus quisquiliarum]|uniref:Pur operon repressor n=1 Tax=Cerasibacillus quisquiliarum TaxID=227865 RepID=A0A511UXE3_9BACI|nr:pur operon repressor [Cerasibacillus quisquiliarum]MBB5146575.1 purine operon repressor [Cerasibacillus quisquiliarum]GEN31274.1 Pur operon repressor [Cerasibacillus quisquiliarum]
MKREERIVGMVNFFLENPRKLKRLAFFAEQFNSGKTTISEDINIIDNIFKKQEIGYIKRIIGPTGGVMFVPVVSFADSEHFIHNLCDRLSEPKRILPGGYLYMTDILSEPSTVKQLGKLLATVFVDKDIDIVMTVETKGISLAYAVASYLNVPVVIVRRDPKVTEGSSVSINYVSGSTGKIQTMVLSKRSLQAGDRVCVVDDFMKAGGTINGMMNLLSEFDAELAAIGVLAEADELKELRVIDEDYVSLVKLTEMDQRKKMIQVRPGNYLNILNKIVKTSFL